MDKTKFNQIIDTYKDMLIISPEYLAASSILDLNIDVTKLIPYIIEAQQLKLEEMIGTPLYNKLLENELTFEYVKLRDDYVSPTLLHWSLASYLQYGGVQIANGGIYNHLPTDASPISRSEIAGMIKTEGFKAQQYANRMNDFLHTYKDFYPEYTDDVAEGVKAKREQKFTGGWLLEDASYTCSELTKDEDIFTVVSYWGNSDESDPTVLDETSLAMSDDVLPTIVTAQPVNDWYWIVTDERVKIQQVGIDIPLGSFDDADQLTQTYVYGEESGKHYIRIAIADTYESAVTFNIVKV